MVIGAILGIVYCFDLIGMTMSGTIGTELGPPGQVALIGVAALVGGSLLSLILPRIVGMAATGAMGGAAISAVLALVRGEAAYTLPLLALAFGSWVATRAAAAVLSAHVVREFTPPTQYPSDWPPSGSTASFWEGRTREDQWPRA
jgi:hypothetical protein